MEMSSREFLILLGYKKRDAGRIGDFLSENPDFPIQKKSQRTQNVIFNEELIQWLWQRSEKIQQEDDNSADYWELEKLKLDVHKARHHKAVYSKKSADTAVIRDNLVQEYSRIRSKLLNLSYQLPNALFKKSIGQIEDILNSKIREVLEELAQVDVEEADY